MSYPVSWFNRFSRPVTLALVVFCTPLLLSHTAYADDAARLKALQKSIAELKSQLESTKSTQQDINNALEKSEKDIGNLSKKAEQLKSDLDKENDKLKKLKDERGQLQQKKKQQQQLVAEHINAAYRTGNKNQLYLLLNQQSPADLSRTLRYYDYFINARSEKISGYLSTIKRLDVIEPEIAASTSHITQQLDGLQQKKRALQFAHADRQKLLTKINRDLSGKNKQLEKLQQDQRQLEALISRVSNYIDDVDLASNDLSFAQSKGKLPWPTQGKVITRYGSNRIANRIKWQGIRIHASAGREVAAVYHGRVVFSDYLRGHGLLIILDHGSGFMSLYAHNQSLYKELGEWVDQGDIIATVGDSGGQEQTALYFELRHNGKPTNPIRWLKSA